MSRTDGVLPLCEALALGALHGPSERLPISSSGHTTLLAWRRSWAYTALEPGARKRFEVALHAGTTAALLLGGRRRPRWPGRRRIGMLALATAPPALAGLALQRPIERRLGSPATIAGGLLAGSAAMALADRLGSRERHAQDAGALDGLALGMAQILALIPGVSRSAAARVAARARGFDGADAARLAYDVGMPITLGAIALKGRETIVSDRREWPALGIGATAAFLSTLLGRALTRPLEQAHSLAPFIAYRTSLAIAVIRRLRRQAER
jgi:undecaprenyl-diphosphatase